MKSINGFQCEKCQHIYDVEKEALDCETAHVKRKDGATIIGVDWKDANETWGFQRLQDEMYPKSVLIRFSDGHGDFAEYTLGRVGYRGM